MNVPINTLPGIAREISSLGVHGVLRDVQERLITEIIQTNKQTKERVVAVVWYISPPADKQTPQQLKVSLYCGNSESVC